MKKQEGSSCFWFSNDRRQINELRQRRDKSEQISFVFLIHSHQDIIISVMSRSNHSIQKIKIPTNIMNWIINKQPIINRGETRLGVELKWLDTEKNVTRVSWRRFRSNDAHALNPTQANYLLIEPELLAALGTQDKATNALKRSFSFRIHENHPPWWESQRDFRDEIVEILRAPILVRLASGQICIEIQSANRTMLFSLRHDSPPFWWVGY
jgi:hypothetical protein